MEQVKMPSLLTPEIISALAANAGVLRDIVSSGDEKIAMGQSNCHDSDCCCPKFIKFKFILCNVTIINKNAACRDDCAAD